MNLYLVQYRCDGCEDTHSVYVVAEGMETALLKAKTQIFFQSCLMFVDVSLESIDVIV